MDGPTEEFKWASLSLAPTYSAHVNQPLKPTQSFKTSTTTGSLIKAL